MDTFNLKTASAYINNLLLARGLLRNGKPIEFARPSKSEAGKEATMAQIINLIHDMILRRDREQEQRESLSATLRGLATEASRNTTAMERLQTRNEDMARQLSLTGSQERAARTALRAAEGAARAHREEMARLKATVAQIRTTCANDVRKRDVQIQKLKSHLSAQQRGNKTGLVGASIVITPGATGAVGNRSSSREEESPDLEDPAYSLRQETTEFLTELSQSLSDENDNLIGLVRTTLLTLKELQGLPEIAERAELPNIMEDGENKEHMVQVLPTSYESLASDMHNVLENLQSLLTNPNFVPIEEVSIREEEILRLRNGWEKMEVKWREAITMMDGWRKRMQRGGGTVNIEELKMGLGLGKGLDTPTKAFQVASDRDLASDDDLDDFDDAASVGSGSVDELDLVQPEPEDMEEETQEETRGGTCAEDIAEQHALKEGHGNKSPRKVGFASRKNGPAVSAPLKDENDEGIHGLPTPSFKRPRTSLGKHKSTASLEAESRIPRKVRFSNSTILATPEADRTTPSLVYQFFDPLQTLKRLSSPSPQREEAPELTVQEKLNIAEAEAEAAAVAAGLELDGLEVQFEGFQPEEKARGRADSRGYEARKTRIGGRARRRKSTMTPAELDVLLFG